MIRWALVALLVMCGVAQAAVDFNDFHVSVWPMATDTAGEVRLGAAFGVFEGYIAPRYDHDQLDTENDFLTTVRAYALYNAFDANMAAYFLDSSVPIPAGKIYGGLFGGYAIDGGTMEFGWLVGGRVQIYKDAHAEINGCLEYQRHWTQVSVYGGSGYSIMVGPQFLF